MERTGFHKEASQTALEDTTLPATESSEESIPRAIVPWNRDDDRSRYLGLRASGFTVREALGLIAKAKSTLSLWRKDPVFLDLETEKLPELRRTLALEYASLEFLRNYRLILEKDGRVIRGSLTRKTTIDEDGSPRVIPQDGQDFQYLLKLRAHYTPQQLQAIEVLFGKKGNGEEDFNWTEFFLTMSETKKEVTIGTRHRQEPELSAVDGKFKEIKEVGKKTDNSKD